jgi:hypothetical protein
MRLKECFSDEEIRKINRIRFKLTKILKEFNKVNSKFVAHLEVYTWSYDIDCDKHVFYSVYLYRRDYDPDRDRDDYVRMSFYYDVDGDLRDVGGFHNYIYISNFEEAFDLVLLFVRLLVTFYMA